jgi:hypothetical protein
LSIPEPGSAAFSPRKPSRLSRLRSNDPQKGKSLLDEKSYNKQKAPAFEKKTLEF